jgi:hypothetical protein
MITIANVGPPTLMGVPIGMNVPNTDMSYLSITDGLEQHEEDFPQFHGTYISFMGIATKVLNLEAVNVLKPFGLTDPTQPLVDLINNIKSNFGEVIPASIDIDVLLIAKLPKIATKIEDFIGFLNDLIDAPSIADVPLERLNSILDTIFEDNPTALQNIKTKITESKESILGNMKQKAIQFFEGLTGSMPEISIPDPLIGMGLIFPGLPSLPEIPAVLFSPGPPPGILGFLVNFLKSMVAEVTAKISEMLGFPIPTVADLVSAIADGIEGVISFFIDQLLGPIKKALFDSWPDIEDHALPASFFSGFLLTALKIIIVAIVGVLLGPGLISFGIAKTLKLI